MTTVTEEPEAGEDGDGLTPQFQQFLDVAMAKLGGNEGWADLDPNKLGATLEKQRREQTQAMRKEAMIFRDVFATPAGKRLMNFLISRTLTRATWPLEGMTNMEMLSANGLWREAENSFVAGMIEAVAVAERQNPKRRSDP